MIEVYTKDGKQTFESAKDNEYKNALKHANRKDGPAVITYYENGNIQYEEWYLNGKWHRENGPAVIKYNNNNNNIEWEKWFINGKESREDGPAEIWYYENGNISYKKWYLNGKESREDGPSYISYFENGNISYQRYALNGKRHREDGPALIWYNKNKTIKGEEYWLNHKEYSFEDWVKKLNIKEIILQSQNELMKQMTKDKVHYNGQEHYISTTGNKPIVYTIKESKIFESFKESYNKLK